MKEYNQTLKFGDKGVYHFLLCFVSWVCFWGNRMLQYFRNEKQPLSWRIRWAAQNEKDDGLGRERRMAGGGLPGGEGRREKAKDRGLYCPLVGMHSREN